MSNYINWLSKSEQRDLVKYISIAVQEVSEVREVDLLKDIESGLSICLTHQGLVDIICNSRLRRNISWDRCLNETWLSWKSRTSTLKITSCNSLSRSSHALGVLPIIRKSNGKQIRKIHSSVKKRNAFIEFLVRLSEWKNEREFRVRRLSFPHKPRANRREANQLKLANEAEHNWDYYWRPKVRGDCFKFPRPCPYVSCRHHLYIDIKGTSMKINFPDFHPWELPFSCSLDVAALGDFTLEEIGAMTNLTRERIRQIIAAALPKIRDEESLEEYRTFAQNYEDQLAL